MKIILPLLVLIVVIALLAITGKSSVHQEILIQSTPEKIWNTLLNTGDYSWNPVMQLQHGELEEGKKVTYLFTQDEETSYEIKTEVIEITEDSLLHQRGGVPMIITFNHKYILQKKDSGTLLIIHEDYSGIYTHFWNTAAVNDAYARLGNAIKKQVES